MPSAKRGLFTSIFVTLALVHHGAASGFQSTPEEDEPATVSSLSTKITDFILVSFEKPWNEAHASFARLLGAPITTWRVPNEGFVTPPYRSNTQFKKPVFVAADPGESFELNRKTQHEAWLPWSTWLFVRHHSQIRSHITSSWPAITHGAVVGVLGMNSTVIQSIFWLHDNSTDHNLGSKEMLAKLRIPNPSNVNRPIHKLTVGCGNNIFDGGTQNYCDETKFKNIIALLIAKNVTVKRLDIPDGDVLKKFGLPDSWDIVLFNHGVRFQGLFLFDYPSFLLYYDTFYTRVDCHRVITLLEAAAESWKLAVTTVFLIALVLLVSVAVGQKGWSALRRVSDTAMFLLASVLGTSTVLPDVVRLMPLPRKALLGLLGLWLVAILPLSVYFRSELTSMLTLKRPAYRIDTVQKLEDALDRNEVAPCVVDTSIEQFDLKNNLDNVTQRSLISKLRFAFEKHGAQALVTKDEAACLHCALRRDRVCFARAMISSPFPNKCPNVGELVEPFRVEQWALPMIKFHQLYEPLKIFFLVAKERGLIDRDDEQHDHGGADNQFDVGGIFTLLAIAHAASCLVLLLEILVARCQHRT